MGRSKFPGKPSKHVNRKRINVLPPPSSAADAIAECRSVSQLETSEDGKQADAPETAADHHRTTKVPLKRLKKKTLVNTATSKRNLLTKICGGVIKKNATAARKGKQVRGYSSSMKRFKTRPDVPKDTASSLVGKFVLPSRSVHSSRVIKPNKRFIDLESTTRLNNNNNNNNNKRKVVDEATALSGDPSDKSHAQATNSASQGRVVLRQARLKLHNYIPKGEGPFSGNASCPSGTVTCGVCGAVRFYRFVKQARKFNIYSCESCRKFVSKMIKKQSCGKTTSPALECHQGQGMCQVPPIVRSQQNKFVQRCPACWLKMCLRSFQMPLALKNGLAQLLPKSMQGTDIIFSNSLPLLWQTKTTATTGDNSSDLTKTTRPVRFKNPATKNTVEVKRQKVDLKGPRVKHVCRSASIVLGQPLATFPPPAEAPKKADVPEHTPLDSLDNTHHSNSVHLLSETESSDSDKMPCLPFFIPSSSSSFALRNKKVEYDPETMISTDFCDDYDFDDVSQNGFCLVASQQFPMPEICFLCGSAGCEALLHCALCCEPYHSFCLLTSPGSSNNITWICPKCTACASCKERDRQKVYCPRCSMGYHFDCFINLDLAKTKSNICFKCRTCQGCGKDGNPVSSYGNLLLCDACFKIRKRCPCPVCKDSINFKMLECTKCSKWIHTKCDNISPDYYNILTILPEHVKYVCKSCCPIGQNQQWRRAVETKMKSSFTQVLYMLSRNKIARQIIKKDQFFDNASDNSDTCTSLLQQIRRQLTSNKFKKSIRLFYKDVESALRTQRNCQEILSVYRVIFESIFPWFDNNETDEDGHSGELLDDGTSLDNIDEDDACDQIKCTGIDSRYCSFCKSIGDGLSHLESRLLYCGQNQWVHINCALWSSEVYEEIDGSLQNVHLALSRGPLMRCSYCKQKGATVGCGYDNCTETYHFICARTSKCHFLLNKTVYCSEHDLSTGSNVILTPTEFNIRRTVFVDMSNIRKGNFSLIDKINVTVGSLCVTSLGKINPTISESVPTNYVCSRLFWSTVEPWKLVSYNISTSISNPHLVKSHNSSTVERNFTVDHTLPRGVVERKMKEITIWQRDNDFEDDEEPQNGAADLLSPEITDAIIEELPHELLELMSCEDFLSATDSLDNSSSTKDRLECKKDDYLLDDSRSCSLTLSCNYAPIIKKRKVPSRDNNLFLQMLQVDGNFDDSSSSECGSPNDQCAVQWDGSSEEPVTCERCQCTYRTRESYKRHLDTCEVISESDSEQNVDDNIHSSDSMVLTCYESYHQNQVQVLNTQTLVKSNLQNLIESQQITTTTVDNNKTDDFITAEIPVASATTTTTQYCLNQNTMPICIDPQSFQLQQHIQNPLMNQIISQPLSLDFQQQQPVTIQANQWMKPQKAKSTKYRTTGRMLQPPVIAVQHLQPSFIAPTFVDTFQHQSEQNVQYVVTQQPFQNQQLMQIHHDNNLISLVQPTMIIQQPLQIDNSSNQHQLVVDSNGSLSWQAPALQPVYYGFETIVQNTVMQSQQFIPSTVPGMLTANSSYSTTTQVFQTSKVEPVIDMTPASNYVLVNHTPQLQVAQPQPKTTIPTSVITLPTSPFVCEQKIPPTNVVVPTPKTPQQGRPMSRVLPMQNIKDVDKVRVGHNSQSKNRVELFNNKKATTPIPKPQPIVAKCEIEEDDKIKIESVRILQKATTISNDKVAIISNESVKKAKPDGAVKAGSVVKTQVVNNNLFSSPCKSSPVQIAPLRPIKSNILNDKANNRPPVPPPQLMVNNHVKPPVQAIGTSSICKEVKDEWDKAFLNGHTDKVKKFDNDNENNTQRMIYTVETHDGFKYSSSSMAELWTKVFEAVQTARAAHNMPLLPTETGNVFDCLQTFGLKTSGLKYLVDQLPGNRKSRGEASKLSDSEDEPSGHFFGSAKCMPNVKRHNPYDMFGWLASKHRRPEHSLIDTEMFSRRGSANNLPMAMRFRQLKLTSKYSVGVYRSQIHRRGLFCLKDFDAGDMVIEYAGEVIRSILTDKREKHYNSKGIGCYMFRIDDNLVVDATMKGNAARFINHSCDPNCYSKVVEILGHKHIIIFALRRIICGEELTYDYKFPIEEDKIPCTCGTRRCRKFLN